MTGKSVDSVRGEFNRLMDAQNLVIANADQAYKTAGLSMNEYLSQATSFSASLLQSLNGDTVATAKVTDMAIIDMADNANKMGTSIESIQNAYQGFAKQNYTMLDNLKLGYGGTKTEMERLLTDATKISGVKYDISNLNDVFEAIHVIQGELGITGTTAKEASETISGSLGMMKSAWSNLVSGLGDTSADFDSLLKNFIDSVGTLGKNLLPVVKTALKGVVRLIKELAPQIIAMLPPLFAELLPAVIEATTGLISALVQNFPAMLQVLVDSLPMFIDAVMQIVDGIVAYLPQLIVVLSQLIVGIVNALIQPTNLQLILKAGLTLLIELVKAIPQIIQNFAQAIPTLIDSIVEFLTSPESIKMVIVAGIELFMALVKAVPQILGALFKAFGDLFGKLWDRLKTLFTEFAGKFGNAIGSVFKGAINGVLAFIENFINAPIDIINGFVDTINSAFGAVGVNIGKIGRVSLGRMASGGIVPSTAGGRLILAGEGGQDEWVVPESKMASMIEQINERTNSGVGGGVTINVFGTFATSEAEQRRVAEQIYDKLQEINKARMGAYL
jgi:phage-related protein